MPERTSRSADDAILERLTRVKQTRRQPTPALGPELIQFFKQSVQKRQQKFGALSEAWETLVPELLREHAAFDSFSKGILTVIVDSSPHLYELKQLLSAGVQQQLLIACRSTGLRKIQLKSGRWYDGTVDRKRLNFQ